MVNGILITALVFTGFALSSFLQAPKRSRRERRAAFLVVVGLTVFAAVSVAARDWIATGPTVVAAGLYAWMWRRRGSAA